MPRLLGLVGLILFACAPPQGPAAEGPHAPDLRGYRADCGIRVHAEPDGLAVEWPAGPAPARVVLNSDPREPLIRSLELDGRAILGPLDPVLTVTVGTRLASEGRPPAMDPFNEFFDSPAQRPHETHAGQHDPNGPRAFTVSSAGRRASVSLAGLHAGPFTGRWQLGFFAGSPLVQLEAVVRTDRPRTAFLYDLGLAAPASPPWNRIGWMDTDGALQHAEPGDDRTVAVRHRALVAESREGSVAILPPPHQFFFPRDFTDNLKTAWFGAGHRGLIPVSAFGIGQATTGGGSFVPWFNAPPGTEQHLGAFLLLSPGDTAAALDQTLRYTHGDRFPALPGAATFTTHWHLARSVQAMKERAEGRLQTPEFVSMFKDMGVQIVHLAEFHGDGHPQDPGPVRRAELQAMFDECRRLSDDQILFLPGEEANVYLGPSRSLGPAGHWVYLFPRPVAWIMKREASQPFVAADPDFGQLYRVGDRADMQRLLEVEKGLAWTAHPRIKASAWAPDSYREEDFYRSDHWLGAAWKAMPADLSREKLGERVLGLLDDMANWGQRKYVPGEVDVFQLDRTHELYGHMNINYLQLDRLPRHGESWEPVMDALRDGRFFVTTGEVLIRDFRIGGQSSGGTLPPGRARMQASLSWTFPLKFGEIVSGDGTAVHRERIDLADTGEFGQRELARELDLTGRRWARFEVWDVAGNGAFSQPIWIGP